MKRTIGIIPALVVISLLFALLGGFVPAAAQDQPRYIIHFKPGTTQSDMESAHAAGGGVIERALPQIRTHVIRIPAAAVGERLAAYKAQSWIEYIEPDYEVKVAETPNDPDISQQWGLARIQAPQAWEITHGSRAVPIAILDTGIDTTHPDLAGKIIMNKNFTASQTFDDKYGHGTHVAGIAAASTANGTGVAGVGYESSLMNVKVLGDNGAGYYSDIAAGMIWAADNGAKVINLSIGADIESQTLRDALDYAWGKGAVVTVAAGNGGGTAPSYPAYYEHAMAVAATDTADRLYSFSNRGDWVDVAAPGSAISTLPGGSYGTMSGTSMASPHVAGLAALAFAIVSDTNGNGFLNDEVRALIQNGCDALASGSAGSGRINAYRTLSTVKSAPVPAGGNIKGTVFNAANGKPLAGAMVSDGSRSAVTSADGSYSLASLPAGSYTLSASARDYTASNPRSVNLADGQSASADFALIPHGSISGTVTDSSTGQPVGGAAVSVGRRTTVAGADGRYVFSGIPAGNCTVNVAANGYQPQSRNITVYAASSATANLSLNRAAAIYTR